MARGATSTTRPEPDWAGAAVLLTLGLTLARIVALYRSPLELYPDEAQYWLWSRTLDFGYYSKPPMIAWAIWATTHIGGDAEAWVRLSAPLFQAGATLTVFALGRKLYGGRAGLAAAALYGLMPAVQISGLVVATDAPLLFFLGLTTLAYAEIQAATGGRRLALAAGLGAALGLAFLSKYAALYAVIGIALHLAVSREARRAWSPAAVGLAVAVLALVLAPNLVWNAQHGFETLHHTAADAAWNDGHGLFNPGKLAQFIGTQFGIFGPIPLGVLAAGVVLAARRRSLPREDLLLLSFIVPPLAIVSAQALISRANANWSGASYLPGAVLAAAWLLRWGARRWLAAAVAMQAVLAALVLAVVVDPHVADRTGMGNSLKRVRGWRESVQLVIARARSESAGLSAIAVNDRFLYYSLTYYGRAYLRTPAAPPLRYWLLTGTPENQAEASAPLTPALGGRVLAVSLEGSYLKAMTGDFRQASEREIDDVFLDPRHVRKIVMFIGQGFAPRPRDPRTGRPIQP